VAHEAPQRLVLTNLRTGRDLECQFNPEQLDEVLSTEWNRLTPRGAGGVRRHFSHTTNLTLDLTLWWRAMGDDEQARLLEARQLLHAWTYPRRATRNSAGGGPPDLLLVWPGMLVITVNLISARLSHVHFAPNGKSRRFSATCQFEEVFDIGLTESEVTADYGGRLGSGL